MTAASPRRARHRARDLLVKALYQWRVTEHGYDELMKQFSTRSDFARSDQQYFRELLAIAMREAEAIDHSIARFAERGLEPLDSVSRSVLHLAFSELEHRPDVPAKVVINEAVELAKRYGAEDTFRFVNAVLDKAARVGPGGDIRPRVDRSAAEGDEGGGASG